MGRRHVEQAIKKAGSQAALGTLIGHSQNAVHQALKRGRFSPRMAIKVFRATGVAVHLLCPDTDWHALSRGVSPDAKPASRLGLRVIQT